MELAPGPTQWGELDELQLLDRQFEAAAGPGHPASALKPGVRSGNGAAVAGVDGYLFIGDGSNRWEQQYQHAQNLPETWLGGWLKIFDKRQVEARTRGVELWNLVIPEKQVVFPEKRWPENAPAGDRRPWRQLSERLRPEQNVHYGQAGLEAARDRSPLYFRHNSHCTPSGCCALVDGLLAAMGLEARLAGRRLGFTSGQRAHDLTVHLFDPAPQEDYAWLHPAGEIAFDSKGFERTGRYTGTSYGIRNPDAPDRRRVIVFGDSYSYDVGVTFALSAIFLDTVFVWSKDLVWDEVQRHGAQLIIWESAERFLASLPEA